MKSLVLVAFAACAEDDLDPPWQLDHDRIVAVRATPPRIMAGEVSMIDALVAHRGAPTDVESVISAGAPAAPGGLFTFVHFQIDHWEIHAPTDAELEPARAELGLPAGAPVPLEVTIRVASSNGVPLAATKTVWLGDSAVNPSLPAIAIEDAIPTASVVVPFATDVALVAEAHTVDWLSSLGMLQDASEPHAVLHVEPGDPHEGELAVVVHDGAGGVVWHVWPIQAR